MKSLAKMTLSNVWIKYKEENINCLSEILVKQYFNFQNEYSIDKLGEKKCHSATQQNYSCLKLMMCTKSYRFSRIL